MFTRCLPKRRGAVQGAKAIALTRERASIQHGVMKRAGRPRYDYLMLTHITSDPEMTLGVKSG